VNRQARRLLTLCTVNKALCLGLLSEPRGRDSNKEQRRRREDVED
jgi:hypothetical protein